MTVTMSKLAEIKIRMIRSEFFIGLKVGGRWSIVKGERCPQSTMTNLDRGPT
jgi:hypothetical protein